MKKFLTVLHGKHDQGVECLGEKGAVEFLMHYSYKQKTKFLIYEVQPLKCRYLFQTPCIHTVCLERNGKCFTGRYHHLQGHFVNYPFLAARG